jgi:hypothetical protein
MTPSSQKVDQRPISFVLHDMAAGAAPFVFQMVIRPEELTTTEPSRHAAHQTFGGDGGWIDSFGPALGSAQLSGHTGWRGNETDDGAALFLRLKLTVYQEYHAARARAVAAGKDPALVKLVFIDVLDSLQWLVYPERFVLRRSKSRPLLMQFNINLIKLAEDVSETVDTGANGAGLPTNPVAATQQLAAAKASLQQSISDVQAFNAKLAGDTGAALGAIAGPLASFSSAAVGTFQQVLAAGTGGPLGVAQQMAQAARSVTSSLSALESIPLMARGQLSLVSASFENAFCLLRNVFSRQQQYEDYSAFYGASNCSSTWQGGQVSPFTQGGTSGLAVLFPPTAAASTQTSSQADALRALTTMDPVLNPQSSGWMSARMLEAVSG